MIRHCEVTATDLTGDDGATPMRVATRTVIHGLRILVTASYAYHCKPILRILHCQWHRRRRRQHVGCPIVLHGDSGMGRGVGFLPTARTTTLT